MNENVIRKAAICDASQIAEIENVCFALPWSEKSISDFIGESNTLILVAVYKNLIVGYIGMYHSFGESDITNVAVLPQYRNNGIAGRLINALRDYCRSNGITKVRLEVRQSNNPAISLYKKHGFYEVGVRNNFYSHPKENAVLMDLDIESATV